MVPGEVERPFALNVPRRAGLRRAVKFTICGLFLAAGAVLYSAVQRARETAIVSGSQSPLNQLQLAFRNYHSVYGCFPPAYVAGSDGKPMHSWRALILPYVDAAQLYEQYDFSQPWNSEKNGALADRMPRIFHCPSEKPSSTHTNFVAIVGAETAFPGSVSTSLADFEDGLDNTVLLVEIANSTIGWLEPRDLNFDTMSFTINDPAKTCLSTSRRNGPYVVFADDISAYAVTPDLNADVLKALTTIKGQEALFMANVEGPEFRGLVSPKAGAATDADLSHFGNWQNVQDLWLNRSPVTDAGLANLRSARHLNKVHLAATSITDEGLKHFQGRDYLYSLDLSDTQITDAGLEHLRDLVAVYYLDLRGTHVTAPGIVRFLRSRPNTVISESAGTTVTFSEGVVSLQFLDLSRTNATDEDLEHFRELEGLRNAYLNDTQIGDAGLRHVAGWPNLQSLNLNHTRVTDAGMKELATLRHLSYLELAGTRVTSAGLVHLSTLPELASLDLSSTEIDDDGLRNLGTQSNLWRLDLSGTKITDAGLAYVRKLPTLRELNLRGTRVSADAANELRRAFPALKIGD